MVFCAQNNFKSSRREFISEVKQHNEGHKRGKMLLVFNVRGGYIQW